MDPLSVSSGVVGLLAFAMQMATVATQVKQVVDQFKSAPKEIEELLQRLTLLQTMCELVKVKVAGVPGYTGGSSSGSLDAISTALLQCQSKMEDLSRTLSATGLNPSQARIPLSKSEAFSRLRFVLRREKVKSMVQDVDHVISLLHLVLTMDTWMTTVSLSQTPGLSHPDNVQSSVSSLQDVPSVETQSALPRPAVSMSLGRVEGAPRKKRHSSRNMGLINWTTVETWAEGQDDAFGVPPERSGNITLRLPFTSVQLDLHYTQFMGTPSYALNINHNIDPYSGFGYQITELFWERDLLGLKKLLSDRKLSIYSVLGDTSLFYLSVSLRWPEACRYLLDHDFRHKAFLERAPKFFCSVITGLSPDMTCEVTETFLSLRDGDIQTDDMRYLLESAWDPGYYWVYLQRFLGEPMSDYEEKVQLAWSVAIETITSYPPLSEIRSACGWPAVFRFLIERGADVHTTIHHGQSAYLSLLSVAADTPLEVDILMEWWLSTLQSCGVPIGPYIERETRTIYRHWADDPFHNHDGARRLATFGFEGHSAPTWRWNIDPEGKASEVLGEFQNLGPGYIAGGKLKPYISGPGDFNCWFATGAERYDRWRFFPFRPAPLDYYEYSPCEKHEPYLLETYKLALKIRDGRVARREARKLRRAHPGRKPSTQMMPGSWVD